MATWQYCPTGKQAIFHHLQWKSGASSSSIQLGAWGVPAVGAETGIGLAKTWEIWRLKRVPQTVHIIWDIKNGLLN